MNIDVKWVAIGLTVLGLIGGGWKGYNYMEFTVKQNTETVSELADEIESLNEKIDGLRWEIYQQNLGHASIVAPKPESMNNE